MFYFQDSTNADTPQEIDLNPGVALEKLDSWLDGFIRILPNLILAIILFIIIYQVAKIVRRLVAKTFRGRGRDNLGKIMGGFVRWLVVIMGGLLCATIVMPTLSLGDLVAGLGVSSVAIGFAFKDILQNWLAGMLILLRQPFEIGDQISVSGFEGTVEEIETRATIIRTYSNEKVVIPNSQIYTSALEVKTAYEVRRSQYDVGIGYADDIEEACKVMRKAVESVEGVNKDRGIDILPWDLAASWVTIRVRWWTDVERADVVKNHAAVIEKIKYALDEAGIDMPYDTEVLLFHDQTDELDGDRSRQREGWPDLETTPQPRWKKELEMRNKKSGE